MKSLQSSLPLFEIQVPKKTNIMSERADLISQFVERINLNRPCIYRDKDGRPKKAGKVTPKQIAVRVGHIKDLGTLYYLLSVCKSDTNFSKRFFWETRSY